MIKEGVLKKRDIEKGNIEVRRKKDRKEREGVGERERDREGEAGSNKCLEKWPTLQPHTHTQIHTHTQTNLPLHIQRKIK